MKVNFCKSSLIFSIMLSIWLSTWPAYGLAVDFYLSGFGTIGVSCFDNNNADFRRDDVPKGPGRTHRCSGELDSKIGVQGDWTLTDSLEATLQLTAMHNSDDSFEPQLTLANLRWQFADNWKMRVGRMQNPNFMYSEFRNVNYAQPWARPIGELYNTLPTFLHDGIEFLYSHRINDWQFEYHMGLAQSDFQYPLSNTADQLQVNIQTSYLNISASKGAWLFKAGIAPSRSTATSQMVEGILSSLRTAGETALANDIEINDSPYTLYSAGFQYEHHDWLISGAISTRPTEGFVYHPTAAYISVAKHIGLWTPYIALARLEGEMDDAHNTLNPITQAALYQQVDGLLSSTHDLDRTSLIVGFARELNHQMTLKVQANFIQPDKSSFGDYINHHPAAYDFASPGTDTLFTVNLDFVF